MTRRLPILLYHEFSQDLEGLLQSMKDDGYVTKHLSEVEDYLTTIDADRFPEKTVVLTFDDAFQDFFDQTRHLLKKYAFTATVCVPTGYVSVNAQQRTPSNWEHGPSKPIMTWEEIKILSDEGFEIISHSINHIHLDKIMNDGIDRLRDEIGHSKHVLEVKLGAKAVRFFSYPYGVGWEIPGVVQILREEGYVGALKSEPDQEWSAYRIPRYGVKSGDTIENVLSVFDT